MEQSKTLFTYMCLFAHLEQLPELHLPRAVDFSLYQRCKKASTALLLENFELAQPTIRKYQFVHGDLLSFMDAEMLAHQCDCTSIAGQGLAGQIVERLGIDPFNGRLPDATNPWLASSDSTSTPGTVVFRRCHLTQQWVASCYSQRDACQPHRGETQGMRFDWFKRCLALLRRFMDEKALKSVAFPFGIGCSRTSGGDWLRYEQVLSEWAEENADDFTVYVVKRAD